MFLNSVKLCQKTVLITGAKSGIGFQTALALARRKFRVIMADNKDLTCSKEHIIQTTSNPNIVAKFIDFTSLTCIRTFVEEFKKEEDRLDILINNAGVFCSGRKRTCDGLVATMFRQKHKFQTNLSNTPTIEDLLSKSAPSRVIFVSSIGAFFHNLTIDNINNPEVAPNWDSLSTLLVYYNSKLCNIITANSFARKLKCRGVTSNSLHPGMTATTFLGKNKIVQIPLNLFLPGAEMGAQNSIFLATSKSVDSMTGTFFVNMKEHQQPRITTDSQFCSALWAASEYFVGVTQEERSASNLG